MKRIMPVLLLLLFAAPCFARERAQGDCMQGGHTVVLQGLQSTNDVEESYVSCTVTVYDAGTTNLSTIYADNLGTVKGNPFTSDVNGYWYFYANNGRYDVHFSNSTISSPFTRGDFLLCDPADATGSFSCTGGGASSCPNGASDTRYVDSSSGSDANTGRNWCSAYQTEQTAVAGLGATGGWVYEAPNYTGANASSVPSNIHILRTNQFDALGSTATRFSYPDWTDVTEDHHTFAVNTGGTTADAHTAFTALGPFGNQALISGVLGNTWIPSGSAAGNSEQAGVAGITTNNSALDIAQSDGVYGGCLNNASEGLDCSGVVAVVGNTAAANSTGSFEAIWANVSSQSAMGGAMGLVIRGTGGFIPTTEIDPNSGRPNSMIDLEYGGQSGDSFYSGIYFQAAAVDHWPIVFGANATTLNPHTDVFTFNRWHDYYVGASFDDLSVIKANNGATSSQGSYQAGNYILENSANGSEVVLPINHSGTLKVDGVNPVSFSSTPTFDRSLGSVQTITLTANVTSSTFQNCVAGQTVIFDIIEGGVGGFTFSPPANLHGWDSASSFSTAAGAHNRQMFWCTGNSSFSEGYSVSAMQSGT